MLYWTNCVLLLGYCMFYLILIEMWFVYFPSLVATSLRMYDVYRGNLALQIWKLQRFSTEDCACGPSGKK